MKRSMVFILWFICLSLSFLPLHAQNIEDFVSNYTSSNGEKYMQPLANAFGANLNSGIFQSARIPIMGFHIRGSVVAMLAPIAEDSKTFKATTEEPFTPEQSVDAPTIFGDTNPVSVSGTGGTAFTFPGGFAIEKLPFLVPQVTIGAIRGTEVTLRYFQVTLDDNIDEVKLFGFGIRHNISQYLEDPPLDLAVGFFFQTFEVSNIIDANTSYFGLQASYTSNILTLYAGPAIETSNLDISYQIDDETSINIDMSSDNTFRFTTGAALDLRIIRLFIDYNFSSQSALALGIGLGSFR